MHRTEIAQPAIFAMQVGLAELWKSWGVHPAAVVGHSVSEIAAACVAGLFSLEQGARITALRALFMEDCARGEGKMLAVGLGEEEVRGLIDKHDGTVSIAAFNSPRSVTLAGPTQVAESGQPSSLGRGPAVGQTFLPAVATTSGGQASMPSPREFTWQPEDFGLRRADMASLRVEGPEQSAAVIRSVLEGTPGPARDISVLNAAAALWTAGKEESLEKCAGLAADAVDSGAARDLLAQLDSQPIAVEDLLSTSVGVRILKN